MAAPPVAPFRVRFGAGAFQLVLLPPGASEAGIERAVAGAVGLAPGTLTIRNLVSGATSPFHAGLAGDWEAVLLPGQAPPAGGAAGPGEWRARFPRTASAPPRAPIRRGRRPGARQCFRARGARWALQARTPSPPILPTLLSLLPPLPAALQVAAAAAAAAEYERFPLSTLSFAGPAYRRQSRW